MQTNCIEQRKLLNIVISNQQMLILQVGLETLSLTYHPSMIYKRDKGMQILYKKKIGVLNTQKIALWFYLEI